MGKYLEKLQHMHIGISGTCLAFITLSTSWKMKEITFLKPISIFVAVVMVSLMVLRFVLYPKVVYRELKDPVIGTFYPTIGMATWLISAYFYPHFPRFCSYLWLAIVVYHYGIVIFYTIIRIKERKFSHIMPTCFIVYTGMITGSVASSEMTGEVIPKVAHFMLLFGFTFYTLLLPVVLYIVFLSEVLDDHRLPTVGIVCSPAPLGIVGILSTQKHPNPYMLTWLIITGLILLVVVYTYLLKLFKEGFKPAYASFTFPLAIATLAAYKLSAYFEQQGDHSLHDLFKLLGDIEIFIATYVVFFILLNFITMFVKAINPRLGRKLEEEEELLGGTIYSPEEEIDYNVQPREDES